MKCFTEAQCSEWIQMLNIAERPYHNGVPTDYVFPLTAYTEAWAAQELARHLVDLLGEYEAVLLHVDDWSPYKPEQMALMEAVRRSHREERWLIDARGHLYEPAEKDELIGMFWLTIAFGWSSYLYPSPCTNIIYNWEGEFIDIWNRDSGSRAEVKDLCDTITKASDNG
jgi:hypothetical protein